MTQRHLLAVLISAALLLPGQAASAADDDMLRAFSEAARTLPPAPAAKPQPPAKPAAKPAAKTVSKAEKKAATAPDHSAELTRLRLRVAELEKLSAAPAVKADDALKAQLAASDKKLAALSAEKQQQEKNIATLQQALKEAQQQQSAGSAQLTKQLSDARAAATQSADALKALKAENDKALAALQAESKKQLSAQQAGNDKKLAALSVEKQQQEKNIATLQQALKEAQQQQSAGIAQLTKQLSDARAAATQSADALKALKAENDKALAALQAESKKQLSAQQAESDKKLAALQAESKQQLSAQQAESAQKLAALQTQQAEREKQLAALQTQQAEREKQLAALDSEKQQQAHNLAQLTRELEAAKQQPAAAPKLSAPKSDAERDGYTLGQFIASNAVVQLQMVKDIGLSISMDQLIAGLTTQLQSGDSLLDGEEMARRYATMQASIGKGLNALIEKGYAQLDKKVAKRKALKKDLGMQWFAVKSVKGKLLPDQQAAVSVRVTTLSGKVINDFSHDQVPFNDSLPPLLQEGMSLTGKGGAVEGWALAKDIYEREPLPPWVAPYDVIHYQLAIK
ncbi:hypothetical protein C1Y43_22840 [Pantoea sp. ICBG 828]|uniref:hypothetical protein n=1 Tax=unclassified Pantoea TaxID=2630326 RepID=UPI000CE536A4|nr:MULTISPECIES: hypothetical protein [unclassified Pantoea]NIG36713.1 hypothetical protein [Pantoea sp. Ap-959]PPC65034.1 hypothetical protein C1Y43_22840 [Pantoea sp. ICBG 828]